MSSDMTFIMWTVRQSCQVEKRNDKMEVMKMKQKQVTEDKSETTFMDAMFNAQNASVKLKVASLALRSFVDEYWIDILPIGRRLELDAIVKMLKRQQKKLESSLSEA